MPGARRTSVLRTGAAVSLSLAFHLALLGLGSRLGEDVGLSGLDGEGLRVELISAEHAFAGASQPWPAGAASVARRPERSAAAVVPPVTAMSEGGALAVGASAFSGEATATLVQWPAAPRAKRGGGRTSTPASARRDARVTAPSGPERVPVASMSTPEGVDVEAAMPEDVPVTAAAPPEDVAVAAASAAPETSSATTAPTPPAVTAAAAPSFEVPTSVMSAGHETPGTMTPGASGPGTTALSAPEPPTAPGSFAEPDGVTAAARAPATAMGESPVLAIPGSPAETPAALVASTAYERVREVARNPSVSASARSETMVGRREVFEFLLDHPEFTSHVTRALRLARYRVWRTDDGFFLDDGWGSTGQVSVIYAAQGTRVLYARGEFQGKFLPTIPGEALVTIEYDVQPGEDGKDRLSAAITGQLRLEGAFAEVALRLAGAAALEKAEKEARRLVRIVARVLRATEEMPAALYASLRERPGVPERQLEEFRALLRIP